MRGAAMLGGGLVFYVAGHLLERCNYRGIPVHTPLMNRDYPGKYTNITNVVLTMPVSTVQHINIILCCVCGLSLICVLMLERCPYYMCILH